KRTYTKTTYDNYNGTSFTAGYGNPIQVIAYGDNDASGDEKTTTISYSPNSSAYLVSLPAEVRKYNGVGTGGTLLTDRITYYDGASSITQPTVGNPTKTLSWLNTNSSFVATSKAYDAYGNVTKATDQLNNTSTTAYDTTYHVYATSATNALNQTAS